jgi:hypothetical protein
MCPAAYTLAPVRIVEFVAAVDDGKRRIVDVHIQDGSRNQRRESHGVKYHSRSSSSPTNTRTFV